MMAMAMACVGALLAGQGIKSKLKPNQKQPHALRCFLFSFTILAYFINNFFLSFLHAFIHSFASLAIISFQFIY